VKRSREGVDSPAVNAYRRQTNRRDVRRYLGGVAGAAGRATWPRGAWFVVCWHRRLGWRGGLRTCG
jgi:hypothetical protein